MKPIIPLILRKTPRIRLITQEYLNNNTIKLPNRFVQPHTNLVK